jgi:SAM-dependent methyltransferase
MSADDQFAYGRSARVYDALCRHKDYAAAAAELHQLFAHVAPRAQSLLDVACGTGHHLEHLRHDYAVEGLDISPEMLAVARARCPGVRFHEGSLVDFSLGRTFDIVCCLFGAIGYAATLDNLRASIRCMARHLRPGGVLVVEPWLSPERFIDGQIVFDSVDDPDLKVARMYVTRAEGRIAIYEEQYLVASADGVKHFSERHDIGLFTDQEYRSGFESAGLRVVDAKDMGLFGYGSYVGLADHSQVHG